MRNLEARAWTVDGLVVDNFAGGGGTSAGIELALGRSPDIAINHDPEAIAMHRANHPSTHHVCGNVWDVRPRELCGGRRVALAWFSPDCTYHSKARGGKPFRDPKEARGRRGLASVAVRWAREVRPDVIILENVEEWLDWGPLAENGRPCPRRRGHSFRNWLGKLEAQGYRVEWRMLRACDFGAPTIRRRLFVIARCDGEPIVWPAPTHGPRGRQPYRTAAECIDWSIPCPSIFDRKKPLAEKTLRRIARGIWRFVIEAAEPFIVPMQHENRPVRVAEPLQTVTTQGNKFNLVQPFVVPVSHGGDLRAHPVSEPLRTVTAAHRGEHALVAPTLIQTGYGEREGQAPRSLDLHAPLGTVVADGQKHGLVSAFLAKHYGGHEATGSCARAPVSTVTTQDHHGLVAASMVKLYGSCADGQPLTAPAPTVRAGGTHLAEVRAFLQRYNGAAVGQSLQLPLGSITSARRFGVVTVAGSDYEIVDIGMRMLQPRELFRAQGFEDRYVIDLEVDGKPLSKTAQIRMCGNSVPPQLVAALVSANVPKDRAVAA